MTEPADRADADLHVHRVGSGTAVVLLHGYTADHRSMVSMAEPAFTGRDGFERHYLDLPGMGRSPAGSARSTDDVVAAVRRYVDRELPGRPFALVGSSYGGGVARAIAASHRDLVVGLALFVTMVVADRDRRTLPPRSVLVRDAELVASLDPAEAEEFESMLVVQDASTWPGFRDDLLTASLLADAAALERVRERYELSLVPEDVVPAFEPPVLIVTGRQDHVAGYADQWGLLPHYPRATYVVLDRAGHDLQHEQPALVTALLADWLDRVAEWHGRSRP